jgi:hypothetical protein
MSPIYRTVEIPELPTKQTRRSAFFIYINTLITLLNLQIII